jgi:hypothetical protein
MKVGTSLLSAIFLTACSTYIPPVQGNADCNIVNGSNCLLPFPSSIYEVDDPTTATGVRLDLATSAMPATNAGIHVEAAYFNKKDGFSADAPMLVAFPEGFDATSLAPIGDPGQSLLPTSPTVIVDLTTMQRVPHFAEADANAYSAGGTALIIRPVVRLTEKHRYAVGITKALKSATGGEIARSAAFQAFVDGSDTGNLRADRLHGRYEKAFAGLAAVGVAKDDLVLAWDFTVASDAAVRSDMETARDLAVAAIGTNGANLTFTIDSDDPNDDPPLVAHYIQGHYTAPQFLTDNGSGTSRLARDANGKPMIVGTYTAPFWAVIPACVSNTSKLPVVVYGHGLMGAGDEIDSHNMKYTANYMCAITIATDWRGMSAEDLNSVGAALVDANNFPTVVDHLVQGMINFIALEQIVRGPMAESDTFMMNGNPLIDPDRVYYYGNSQGGIYGGTFMAYDPNIMTGILGVPGANYSMLLDRSTDWTQYHAIQRNAYPDPIDSEILLNIFQQDWDRVDPITTTQGLIGVNGAPVPGTPAKQILMIEAASDSQVPNISTETEARTMGIPVLTPADRVPYGLTGADGPLVNALTIVDEHPTPVPPITNTTVMEDGTHGSVRGRAAIQEQMKIFLYTGQIQQTCADASGTLVGCDCPTDAICGPHE